MQVFLSTVVRGAPLEKGGELIHLDWEKKQVVKRVPLIPPPPMINDENDRGGFRGGRGIVLRPDEILVTTYHTLLGFDYQLRPTRQITNNSFSGLHETKLDGDGLWVTSTPLGALLKVDWQGKTLTEWWAHDDPVVQKAFGVKPLSLDKTADNRLAVVEDGTKSKLHLNSVETHAGRVYVSFNNHGAILRLFPTEVVAHLPELKGCHNGYVTPGGELLLNDSHHHTIIVIDLATGKVRRRINLIEFPAAAELTKSRRYYGVPLGTRVRNWIAQKKMSRPLFTRGMCLLDDTRVLVGVSPASVLEVDYRAGRLLGMFQVSDAVNVCVHGLEATPSLNNPAGA